MPDPKYPLIEVQLTGKDGNAFAILGRVTVALRKAKVPAEEVRSYVREATAADYNHLLRVTMRWVKVL